MNEIFKQVIKYLVEGLAVAICCAILPKNPLKMDEILIIALVAAATFSILDTFIPVAGTSMRQGAGIGLGFKLVGFGL